MSPPLIGGWCGASALTLCAVLTTTAVAQIPPASEPAPLALELDVIAKQLDVARNQIQPSLGASLYEFRRTTLEPQPQGDNQPFNQLLLQAPGVAQDSFGQLHVRGETPICNTASTACSCRRGSMSS